MGEGSFYLRQGLIVLHCGRFLIHMGLLYPKNKFCVRVYQQNVLYFCRILGFSYSIFCLRIHTKVILFWYRCNTIIYFLRSQENLICFLTINILHKRVLVLLEQVIVKFLYVQVRIIDGLFQVLSKTFLEKSYLLCNLISCLNVCHSGLR